MRNFAWLGVLGLWACASAGDPAQDDDDDAPGGDGGPNGDSDGGGGADDDGGSAPASLIDDLDDGDGAIHESEGRIGAWFSFNDGTAGGMQTPAASGEFMPTMGGPGGAGYAAVTRGSGFTEWGAGIGFDLNNPGEAMIETKGVHDASAYQGITFMAKGNAPLRVVVLSKAVVPVEQGGACPPSTTEGMMCEDGHGKTLTLSSTWKRVEVRWADLRQEGWGLPAMLDARTLTGMQFRVSKGVSFDVQIDDIAFF